MKIIRSYPFLYLLGAALAVAVYFSLSTPIAGNLGDVVTLKMNGSSATTPVKLHVLRESYDSARVSYVVASDPNGSTARISLPGGTKFKKDDIVIAEIGYTPSESRFEVISVERVNPLLSFAFIPGLGELGRNMLFHVPMSMVAFLAFFMGTVYSILYLIKKDPSFDRSARASSAAGTLFTLLATITGSIWARFSWGTFWNWDPREVSIFILLLIYFAYFILRSLLEEAEEKKARIAAVYNIIAFVSVPFLMFVIPRIKQSLHPGGGGGEAPIINTSGKVVHTDPTLLDMHWINVLLFVLLFLWMKDLYTRVLSIEARRLES